MATTATADVGEPAGQPLLRPTIPGVILMEHEDTALWRNEALYYFKKSVDEKLYESLVEAELQEAENYKEEVGFFGGISDRFQQMKTDLSKPVNSPCSDNSPDYPRPVGGLGFAKVTSNPKFPAHHFFEKNRLFRVRLRHNNLSLEDDAALDGRVVCIKFIDDDAGGPLDLILHTGRVPQYQNADSFNEYLEAVDAGENGIKSWLFKKPNNYYSRVESLRRGPNSYYDQRYYSHVTYTLEDIDGKIWYTRLRLLPADDCDESGLLDDQDQENVWKTARQEGDTRLPDYLRVEYANRRKNAAILYRLQIQIHEEPENREYQSLYNPWVQWSRQKHPWLDLAVVTITNHISPTILATTNYCLTNHQPCFKPIETSSIKHFSSLSTVLKEFHGIRQGTAALCDDTNDEKETYKVRVITGKQLNAGTDADVFISITGDNGRTKAIELDTQFHDDFEAGQEDDFDLSCSAVGEVLFVDMTISSMLSSRKWFLEEVVVMEPGGSSSRFPCYQWLTHWHPTVTLRRAKPLPPHKELSLFPYLQRKFEIFEKRTRYKWDKVYGLPSRINVKSYEELPQETQFEMEKDLDLTQKYMRTLANTGAGSLLTMIGSWDIIKDNPKLLTKFLKEKSATRSVIEVWRQDEEFGRQVLNGPHPTRLTRTTHLPSVFSKHTDAIQQLMERGLSIDEEMQAGHIYQLSYPELEDLEKCRAYKDKYNRYVIAPHCLLYVNAKSKLVPIAIVLEDAQLVWTPNDAQDDWLFAKMWVREADAQVHQVISRHLQTHLFMETVSLATIRNLPSAHPVYKLLLPHLRYTFAVNVQGRQHMYPAEEGLFEKYLAVGGQHEQLIRKAYKTFSVQMLNIPRDLACRGVDDREALPGYYYRDDALRLWGVIQKFVRTVLILHYWDNDCVKLDEEIHDWIQDLWENGLPVWIEDDEGAKKKTTQRANLEEYDEVQGNQKKVLQSTTSNTQPSKNPLVISSTSKGGKSPPQDEYTTESFLFGKKKMTLKEIAKEYGKDEAIVGKEEEIAPKTKDHMSDVKQISKENKIKSTDMKPATAKTLIAVDQRQVHYDSENKKGVDHGVPKDFDTVMELTDFVTLVIFTASCQHAALTSGSVDYYSYIPNAPTMLLQSPPTEKGKTSMTEIKNALPSKGKTAEIIAACYTLSRLDKDEVYLDQFPEMYFEDPSILQAIMAFQEELTNVSNEIEDRNKGLEMPYTYLIPGKIPKSVSM